MNGFTFIQYPPTTDRAWKRAYWKATKDFYCAKAKTGYPEVARNDPATVKLAKATLPTLLAKDPGHLGLVAGELVDVCLVLLRPRQQRGGVDEGTRIRLAGEGQQDPADGR